MSATNSSPYMVLNDLPFARAAVVPDQTTNRLLIGGYQAAWVTTWSGGCRSASATTNAGSNVNDNPNPAAAGVSPQRDGAHAHRPHLVCDQIPAAPAHALLSGANDGCGHRSGHRYSHNPGLDNSATGSTPIAVRLSSRPILPSPRHHDLGRTSHQFPYDALTPSHTLRVTRAATRSTAHDHPVKGVCGPGNDCGPRPTRILLRVQF